MKSSVHANACIAPHSGCCLAGDPSWEMEMDIDSIRVTRLQKGVGTKVVFRVTKFLRNNAPKSS